MTESSGLLTATYVGEDQFDISTCWIGQQAIITFLGCICGTIGMLLFQKWTATALCILFGIVWGTVALLIIDHVSVGGYNLFSVSSIIENLVLPFVIVWTVCHFCLNIHDWGSVVLSSFLTMLVLGITKNRWNAFRKSNAFRTILIYFKRFLAYFIAKQNVDTGNVVYV